MPPISVIHAPNRATSSDPGTANTANSTSGRLINIPICASVGCISAWMSGITGGAARMTRRVPAPASQSRHRSFTRRPVVRPPEADVGRMHGGGHSARPTLHHGNSRRNRIAALEVCESGVSAACRRLATPPAQTIAGRAPRRPQRQSRDSSSRRIAPATPAVLAQTRDFTGLRSVPTFLRNPSPPSFPRACASPREALRLRE